MKDKKWYETGPDDERIDQAFAAGALAIDGIMDVAPDVVLGLLSDGAARGLGDCATAMTALKSLPADAKQAALMPHIKRASAAILMTFAAQGHYATVKFLRQRKRRVEEDRNATS